MERRTLACQVLSGILLHRRGQNMNPHFIETLIDHWLNNTSAMLATLGDGAQFCVLLGTVPIGLV